MIMMLLIPVGQRTVDTMSLATASFTSYKREAQTLSNSRTALLSFPSPPSPLNPQPTCARCMPTRLKIRVTLQSSPSAPTPCAPAPAPAAAAAAALASGPAGEAVAEDEAEWVASPMVGRRTRTLSPTRTTPEATRPVAMRPR